MWFVLIWFTVIEFDNIVWQQFGFPQVLSRMISQTNVTEPLMLECIKHGADAFDAFDDVLFVCVSMTIDVRDYLGGPWGPSKFCIFGFIRIVLTFIFGVQFCSDNTQYVNVLNRQVSIVRAKIADPVSPGEFKKKHFTNWTQCVGLCTVNKT